jgi:hypothetical protein
MTTSWPAVNVCCDPSCQMVSMGGDGRLTTSVSVAARTSFHATHL